MKFLRKVSASARENTGTKMQIVALIQKLNIWKLAKASVCLEWPWSDLGVTLDCLWIWTALHTAWWSHHPSNVHFVGCSLWHSEESQSSSWVKVVKSFSVFHVHRETKTLVLRAREPTRRQYLWKHSNIYLHRHVLCLRTSRELFPRLVFMP